jgi:hypothetical protein
MAEGKKSFVLYSDIIHTVRKLPNNKAGELFKLILSYVNDENPTTKDLAVDLVFEPIKQQLKRDLKQWEETREKRSEAGKLGGRPKKQEEAKEANAFSEKQTEAKKAVNGNVIVNVNDTVNKIQNIDIDFALELPEQKINNAIEYLSRTRKTEADRDLVLTLWTAFKEKNFTGEKFYKSEAKIFGHFFETLKFEKINGHSATTTSGKHKGAMQLVSSLKQDFAARRKEDS